MANRVTSHFVCERTITPINRRVDFVADNGQTFVFRYRTTELREALRMPGQMVVASKGALSWSDAMVVCEMMRDMQGPRPQGLDECL